MLIAHVEHVSAEAVLKKSVQQFHKALNNAIKIGNLFGGGGIKLVDEDKKHKQELNFLRENKLL